MGDHCELCGHECNEFIYRSDGVALVIHEVCFEKARQIYDKGFEHGKLFAEFTAVDATFIIIE